MMHAHGGPLRRTPGPKAKPLMEKLLEQSIPEPNTGCWLWTGACFSNGYGAISHEGKTLRAHRASYVLNKGEIPEGLCVCHTCDTPVCINPNHLVLMTSAGNSQDMVRKNRQASGDRHGKRLHPETIKYGEEHACSKLTLEQVRNIRSAYEQGETETSLSKKYNTSISNISSIILKRTWRDV